MADSETVRGTVVFLLRREGQQPVIFELELRLPGGTHRLVRVADEVGRALREGQDVEATGTIDANQVLVADTIRPIVAPVPTPPPPPPAGFPWLLLAIPVIAAPAIWVTGITIQNEVAPRAIWLVVAVAIIAFAQRKGTGRSLRIVLRTLGGSALITALALGQRSDGGGVLLLLLGAIALSFVSGFIAIVVFVVRRLNRAPAAPARTADVTPPGPPRG